MVWAALGLAYLFNFCEVLDHNFSKWYPLYFVAFLLETQTFNILWYINAVCVGKYICDVPALNELILAYVAIAYTVPGIAMIVVLQRVRKT